LRRFGRVELDVTRVASVGPLLSRESAFEPAAFQPLERAPTCVCERWRRRRWWRRLYAMAIPPGRERVGRGWDMIRRPRRSAKSPAPEDLLCLRFESCLRVLLQ